MSEAVVLLPFVPVTPTIRPGLRSKKILVADVTHVPAARAAFNSGRPVGTPGDRIMVSYSLRCSRTTRSYCGELTENLKLALLRSV